MQTLIEEKNLLVSSHGTLPKVPFLAIKEKILGARYELSIAFVPPKQARAINIKYRNKDYVPNTLSFSLTKTSGEIFLCKSALRAQYKSFEMDYDTYVTFICIHSMLHLKGMQHGSTMERIEKKLTAFFTTPSTPHEARTTRRH